MQKTWSQNLYDIWKTLFSPMNNKNDSVTGAGMQLGTTAFTDIGSPIQYANFMALNGSQTGTIDPGEYPVADQDIYSTDITSIGRKQRYLSYDNLEEMIPEAKQTLDTYADESVSSDEHGNVLKVRCSDEAIAKELEFLFLDSRMLNLNKTLYAKVRNLCKYGDAFWEIVIDPDDPKNGVLKLSDLDPYTMWVIVNQRGAVMQYQQTPNDPQIQLAVKELEERHRKATRGGENVKPIYNLPTPEFGDTSPGPIVFTKSQVVHLKLGEGERRTYFPYGVSVLDNARRPGFNLRLLEDSMLLYWITRAPERRIFHVDVGGAQGNRVEEIITKFRNGIKRKKFFNERTRQIDETYNPGSVDDDIFLPTRAGLNTKVETLPGAVNADNTTYADYFKKKYYMSVGIPLGYHERTSENSKDTQYTLSSMDNKFAKRIQRNQRIIEDALMEVAKIHLEISGVPAKSFEDLKITLTPSSEWREAAMSELVDRRVTLSKNLRDSGLVTDDYIRTEILKMSDDENMKQKSELCTQALRTSYIETQASEIQARAEISIEKAKAISQAKTQSEIAYAQQQGLTQQTGGPPGLESSDEEVPEGIGENEENTTVGETEKPEGKETTEKPKERKIKIPLGKEKRLYRDGQ